MQASAMHEARMHLLMIPPQAFLASLPTRPNGHPALGLEDLIARPPKTLAPNFRRILPTAFRHRDLVAILDLNIVPFSVETVAIHRREDRELGRNSIYHFVKRMGKLQPKVENSSR